MEGRFSPHYIYIYLTITTYRFKTRFCKTDMCTFEGKRLEFWVPKLLLHGTDKSRPFINAVI